MLAESDETSNLHRAEQDSMLSGRNAGTMSSQLFPSAIDRLVASPSAAAADVARSGQSLTTSGSSVVPNAMSRARARWDTAEFNDLRERYPGAATLPSAAAGVDDVGIDYSSPQRTRRRIQKASSSSRPDESENSFNSLSDSDTDTSIEFDDDIYEDDFEDGVPDLVGDDDDDF